MTATQRAKRRFARYVEARKQFWWPETTTQQPRMYVSPALLGNPSQPKTERVWIEDYLCGWRD